jgi:hypothetical protein
MRDVVFGIISALLQWLEGRAGKAIDIRPDRPRLRLAGARLRSWLRANRPRT